MRQSPRLAWLFHARNLEDLLHWGSWIPDSDRLATSLSMSPLAFMTTMWSFFEALASTVGWSATVEFDLHLRDVAIRGINELDVRRYFGSLGVAASVSKNFAMWVSRASRMTSLRNRYSLVASRRYSTTNGLHFGPCDTAGREHRPTIPRRASLAPQLPAVSQLSLSRCQCVFIRCSLQPF